MLKNWFWDNNEQMPYISTYGVSFRPLICGYNSLKSFDGGWNEFFGGQGLYIILINLRI